MRTRILLCALALALAGSSSLYAQSRKEISAPGLGVTTPGSRSDVASFGAYSTGVGNLGNPYSAPQFGVMSPQTGSAVSGLSNSSPFSVHGVDTIHGLDTNPLTGQGPSALGGPSAGSTLYKGLNPVATDQGGITGAAALMRSRSQQLMPELAAQPTRVIDIKTDKREPIKSLVPQEPGLYHDYLQAGEKAFRDGDYTLALTKFQMANYIGHRDPESILSLSQAYFAGNCYPQAVYRLRQVLKYMPRLAMVRLQPKAFYGDPSVYVENVQQLDDYLATAPGDVDALLLRAYYAWFDTDDPRSAAIATEALTQALSADSTPDDIQAIDAFWSGMVATGRVTGQLKARPAVKAAPTAAAPQRVPKAQRATSASH